VRLVLLVRLARRVLQESLAQPERTAFRGLVRLVLLVPLGRLVLRVPLVRLVLREPLAPPVLTGFRIPASRVHLDLLGTTVKMVVPALLDLLDRQVHKERLRIQERPDPQEQVVLLASEIPVRREHLLT